VSNVKLETEKAWQERYYDERGRRDLVVPPSIRKRYLDPPAQPWFPLEQMFRSVGDVRGKNILCFGCGDDNSTVLLALKGATVWAFDVSEQAIRLQRAMAGANGLSDRIVAVVADAEALPFDAASFDVVFGTAILHHVPDSLVRVSKELLRLLKPGGFALFIEPVVASRALRRIRVRIPVHTEASPGERPLENADLRVLRLYFEMSQLPFVAFARLARFVLRRGVPLELCHPIRRAVVYLLFGLDFVLLRLPMLSSLGGVHVLRLAPKSAGHPGGTIAGGEQRPVIQGTI
jgi:SAM-dependent methyltransferase